MIDILTSPDNADTTHSDTNVEPVHAFRCLFIQPPGMRKHDTKGLKLPKIGGLRSDIINNIYARAYLEEHKGS